MKFTLIAAALLAAAALPSFAAEGSGGAFALRAPGSTAVAAYAADTGSAGYPNVTGRPGSDLSLPSGMSGADTGSEGVVESANSLPAGASAGTDVQVRRDITPSATVLGFARRG